MITKLQHHSNGYAAEEKWHYFPWIFFHIFYYQTITFILSFSHFLISIPEGNDSDNRNNSPFKHGRDHICQLFCPSEVAKSIARIHHGLGYLSSHFLLPVLLQDVGQIGCVQIVHHICSGHRVRKPNKIFRLNKGY